MSYGPNRYGKRPWTSYARYNDRQRLPRLMPQSALGGGGVYPAMRPGYRFTPRTTGALTGMPERKYFDTEYAATAIPASTDWTGTEADPAGFLNLCNPIQGAGINQRVGRKICLKALKIRGYMPFGGTTGGTAITAAPTVRLILFQDMQTNGQQAQGEQVMTPPTVSATGPVAIHSYQNIANFGRFRVLKDRMISVENGVAVNNAAATTVSTEYSSRHFKWNIKFKKPLFVHFNAVNGGTIADIVDHSFHILATADVTNMFLAYQCRAVYTDV